MKVYKGYVPEDGLPGPRRVTVTDAEGGKERPLKHIAYHSPDGFNWGYGGSGPADLALAVLADALGERTTRRQIEQGTSLAWYMHQDYKWDVIARLDPEQPFTIHESDVQAWIAAHTLEAQRAMGDNMVVSYSARSDG